jgi:hypothetical protein
MAPKSDARRDAEAEMIRRPDRPDRYFRETFKLSQPTVSNIRRELRERNIIPPSRRGGNPLSGRVETLLTVDPSAASVDERPVSPQEPASPLPSITPTELLAIGATEFTDENDEETRKKLLARCRAIALDPGMHPDTVLSASQVYIKLKDAVRAKSLGPGRPLTHEDAVARLARLMSACGPNIVHEAITSAFGGTNAAKSGGSTEPVHGPDPAPAASGPTSPPGSDPSPNPNEGSGRPSDMG